MLKSITLSADEKLIEVARRRALERRTTLNAEFRRWLKNFSQVEADGAARAQRFRDLMQKIAGEIEVGRRLTREECSC